MINFKSGDWVRLSRDGRVGCVHENNAGRLLVVVPNEDWPFPSWVHVDIDSVTHSHRPKFMRVGKQEKPVEEFEPAPF